MNEPTAQEITDYVLKHDSNEACALGTTGATPQRQALKSAAINILLRATQIQHSDPQADVFTKTDAYAGAYALASKAYDALTRERNPISGETVRLPMGPVQNLETLLIHALGLRFVECFISEKTKPRIITAPVCGAEYAIFNTKFQQWVLRNTIQCSLPSPYLVKDVTAEFDTEAMNRQYLGWQRPVGEVRVEFGVRE